MSYDPLLTVLGLAALATPTSPAMFAVSSDRAAVSIEPGSLPLSGFDTGSLAIDANDGNTLKWFDGTEWKSAAGGGGLANIASGVTGGTLTLAATLGDAYSVEFTPTPGGIGYVLPFDNTVPSDGVVQIRSGASVSDVNVTGIYTLQFSTAGEVIGAGTIYYNGTRFYAIDGETGEFALAPVRCANDNDSGPFDGMLQLSTIAGDFAVAPGLIWNDFNSQLDVPGSVQVSFVSLVPQEGLGGGSAGDVAYDNTDGRLYYNNGSSWIAAGGPANLATTISGGTVTLSATLSTDTTYTLDANGGQVLSLSVPPLGSALVVWDGSTTIATTTPSMDYIQFTNDVVASDTEGIVRYNFTGNVLEFYNGSTWVACGGGSGLTNIASTVSGDTLTIDATLTGPQSVTFGDFSGTVAVVPVAETGNELPLMWNTSAQAAMPSSTIYNFSTLEFSPSGEPGSPNAGTVYYDSGTEILRYYNNSSWIDILPPPVTSVNGQTGDVTIAPPGDDTQLLFNAAGEFGATAQMFVTGGEYSAYLEMQVDHLNGGGSPTIHLQGYSGPGYDLAGRILFQNGSDDRWAIWPNNVESGSDVGYDFRLMAFGDGGAWSESVLDIVRAQGGAATWYRRVICGATGATTPAVAYFGVSPATNKPTTVANGDFWVVSRSLYVRVNGVDITLGGNNTNTGLGAGALNYTLTGQRNVAVGKNTLAALTTGLSNMAIGEESQLKNTSGTNNIGIGVYTLYELTTGSRNIAIGSEALGLLTDGDDNVAIGENAMYNCVNTGTDGRNVSIGVSAGRTLTTGTNNLFLGYGAGYTGQLATAINSIGIGYQVVTTKSNQIVLGNTSITETVIRGSSDVIFDSTTSLDIGDPTVDGTWRIRRETNDLVMERRESGTFVEKFRVEA